MSRSVVWSLWRRFSTLVLLLIFLGSVQVAADGTWERFPTQSDVQRAWSVYSAELEAAWPGRIRRENLRSIPYHDPTVEDPLNASGMMLSYDSLEIPREGGPPPENEYWVGFLRYDEDDGWEIRSQGRKFNTAAERDRFVNSLFQANPPSLQGFHVYGLNQRTGQYEGRDRQGAAFVRGFAEASGVKLPPPVISDRVRLTVKSTRVEEPWKDASGQLLRNLLVEGTVESASPIVSRSFHRMDPSVKQGYLHIQDGTFSAKGEFVAGETNTFVLAVYNEADLNAEQTLTFGPDGQLSSQVGTDDIGMIGPISDFIDDILDSLPGLDGIGDLPGPESAFEGLVGIILPGVVSILAGLMGGFPGPGSPPLPPLSPDSGGSGSGSDSPTEHTFSDGRSYREGGRYTFHDGKEYEVRDGEFVPTRELNQGERFVDPDGQERVWQGNQAWIPEDWQRQEQTNREYAAAHQADWEVESKRVNPHMAEAMEQIRQDFHQLENLEKMRHQVIFGPRDLDVLAGTETSGGGFQGKIDRVIADFRESGKMDRQAYEQIRRVYGLAVTGQIASHRELHSTSQIFHNTMREGLEGFTREVVTGADSEGKTSYKSMAVRSLAAVLTAGSSEMVYTPANSVYTMKDYVDRGGDSVVEGFLSTTKEVIKGEIIGRFIGRGMQAAAPKVAQIAGRVSKVAEGYFPNATRVVSQKVKSWTETLTKQRRSPFASKVQPPPKIPPKVSPRPSKAEVMERLKQYKAQQGGTPGLKLNNESFTKAAGAADLRGVPVRDQKAIQMVAQRHGVKAHFRPTNPDSKAWLESGRAHPKPEMLKTKTVGKLDTHLGFSKDKVGTVACKKPVMPKSRPPGMSDKDWADLSKRYDQRYTEFLDQQTKLDALVKKGEITWNKTTGEILNAKTGKPFAGDHDAFAFVDALTGKPVNPAVNRQINRELQSMGTTAHGEHVAWDYSKLSKTPPQGSPPGAQSPYDIAAGIDEKILGGHQAGGETLNTYDPLAGQNGDGWGASFWNGGQRVFD